jgi:hypothetical protein
MAEQSKFPSALGLKPRSTGGREKKLNWKLLRKSKRTYRVIWATTLGELESEVNRFIENQDNVELLGPPFHDLNWWQALTYKGK